MNDPIFTRTHLRRWMAFALIAGTFGACDCDEQTFRAAAKYRCNPSNPSEDCTVLNFGDVSVTSEKKLDIVVLDEGTAGLKILMPNVEQDPDKWRLDVREDLLTTGISPNKTSSISVTYRPCPAAWETREINGKMVDILKENFDYETCMNGAAESTHLVIVEVDTDDGSESITLSARPVLPPNVSIYCQNGRADCNFNNPDVDPCTALTFGPVTAGNTPCNLVVEVRNTWKGGKPVGTLDVEGISISVKSIMDEQIVDGPTAGWTVHNLDHSVLNPDSGAPFQVPIATGEQEGRQRFLIEYAGILTGTWDGRESKEMTGLKLFTNDPERPIIYVPLNGTGSSPDIDWQPTYLNFGPVNQGTSKTLTATITNSGDADLRISSIGFALDTAGRELVYTTDRGPSFPITLMPTNRMHVHVTYTPQDTGQDSDKLVIINNDLKEQNRVEIAIHGGAVPILRADPGDVLPYPLTPDRVRPGTIKLSNVGSGELVIQKLEITGPSGDTMHPSVDDFSFADGCANPCTTPITLCFPNDLSCTTMSSTDLVINYENNDVSMIDFAELHIYSTDPSDPDHTVVLSATDDPCLFPQARITYTPPNPCKGRPVTADATTSGPGGPQNMPATIAAYTWEWLFAQPPDPAFLPDNRQAIVTFTPEQGGVYILGLTVENSCGASSALATETINVNDICSD